MYSPMYMYEYIRCLIIHSNLLSSLYIYITYTYLHINTYVFLFIPMYTRYLIIYSYVFPHLSISHKYAYQYQCIYMCFICLHLCVFLCIPMFILNSSLCSSLHISQPTKVQVWASLDEYTSSTPFCFTTQLILFVLARIGTLQNITLEPCSTQY